MKNAEDLPTNPEKYFGNRLNKADEIIAKIRSDIDCLVEDLILSEDPTTIIFVERRGIHLFHHTFGRLIENGFKIGSVRLFRVGCQKVYVNPKVKLHGNIIIGTDAINTGCEIQTLLQYFKFKNIIVQRIFCYYANENGLKKLTTQKLLKEDQVKYIKKVTGEMYEDLSKNMNIYFQSRIVPMDMDHVYYKYTVRPKFTKTEDLKTALNTAVSKLFRDNLEFEHEDYVPKNIVTNFALEIELPKSWKNLETCLGQVAAHELKNYCDIGYIQFKVKMKRNLNFTIMCYSQIEELNISELKDSCPIKKLNKDKYNCIREMIYKKNKDFSENEIICRFCMQCIENYTSQRVLINLEKLLRDILEERNYKLISTSKYYPSKI